MKLNKIVLSLAGIMAAAAFAPEASAVPVFARQTGMACSACHFNHFPLLNSFGRAFKSSGYTLMGAQAKVEGEDLSIPGQLNMGALITAGWQSFSAGQAAVAPKPSQQGFYVPTNGGELSIFWGGKITENSGFLSELGLTQSGLVAGTAAGGGVVGVPTAKFLMLPEVGNNTRVGFSIFSIGQDAASSFELLNTGASSVHRLMGNASNHLPVTSARQYIAPEGGATGVSVIAVNTDLGFVNVAKYASVKPGAFATGSTVSGLPGTYIRAAGFFNLAGFEAAAGLQNWSGYQAPTVNGATTPIGEERATVIDFQMQGELNGKGLGVYASYGTAPSVTPSAANNNSANTFNKVGGATKTSFNVAADYTVMPKVTVQAAYRNAKTPGAIVGSTEGDNALMIGAAYELAMNQHLSLNYTTQSGSSWSATGVNGVANTVGKNTTTILLESLF